MLSDYTTPASVRSVLGVSAMEIKDIVVEDPIYSTALDEVLYGLHPQLVDDYELAKAAEPKTHLQERFVNLVQTFAAYTVAGQMLGSVSMFSAKTIEDSRSKLERFTDAYKNLRDDVLASLLFMKNKLLAVYALINPDAPVPATVARINVVNVGLGVDPVTG